MKSILVLLLSISIVFCAVENELYAEHVAYKEYGKKGDYQNALKHALKLIEYLTPSDKNKIDYAKNEYGKFVSYIYNDIATFYKNLGNSEKEIEYNTEAIRAYFKYLYESYEERLKADKKKFEDPGYIDDDGWGEQLVSLKNNISVENYCQDSYGCETHDLAVAFRSIGDNDRALDFYKQSIDFNRDSGTGFIFSDDFTIYQTIRLLRIKYGENSLQLAEFYLDVANGYIYEIGGKNNEAVRYVTDSIDICLDHLKNGKENKNALDLLYKSFFQLGNYMKFTKNYGTVILTGEKIAEIALKTKDFGDLYRDILGEAYFNVGDYEKSINLLKDIAADSTYYDKSKAMFILAKSYQKVGQYKNSNTIFRDLVNQKFKSLISNGELVISCGDEPEIMELYYNIAHNYLSEGKIDLAIDDYKLAYNIYNHPLAEFCLSSNNKAYGLNLEIIGSTRTPSISTKELMKSNIQNYDKMVKYQQPNEAYSTSWIYFIDSGALLHEMGFLKNAIKYYKVSEEFLEKRNPEPLINLNIATAYHGLKDYNNAAEYAQKAYIDFDNNRKESFKNLQSSDQKKFLENNGLYLLTLVDSIYQAAQSNKANSNIKALKSSAFDFFINSKGSLLDKENTIAMMKYYITDKNILDKIEQFEAKQRTLAELNIQKKDKNEIEKLEKEINGIELELASASEKFQEEKKLEKITISDIANYINNDELYVDFGYAKEQYFVFIADNKKNIDLFVYSYQDSKKINDLINSFRKDIEKLAKSSEQNHTISKESTETLSSLYKLIFNKNISQKLGNHNKFIVSTDGALRLMPFEALVTGSGYFIENNDIRYIMSAKEFVRTHRFNTSDTKNHMAVFSDPAYDKVSSSSVKANISDINTTNVNEEVMTRAVNSVEFFTRLKGFKEEEEAIKGIFADNIDVYNRENASLENMFKVTSPKILHVTTHGFFINDHNILNPMLKSGIALSGANTKTKDGVVTALKLSGLNLQGTDMVVLSACETGVVDMADTNSVAALPKTFMQAGVKNVMMSLWKVDDKQTVGLMKDFYNNIKNVNLDENGAWKSQANNSENEYNVLLKKAKLNMIKQGLHPYYWAAFIINGE